MYTYPDPSVPTNEAGREKQYCNSVVERYLRCHLDSEQLLFGSVRGVRFVVCECHIGEWSTHFASNAMKTNRNRDSSFRFLLGLAMCALENRNLEFYLRKTSFCSALSRPAL